MDAKRSTVDSIDAYIETFPADVQTLLQQLRTTISNAAPTAVEKISYRIPTFHLNGNLVHFAAFANHIGFYPGAAEIARFAEELKPYRSGKGSVQFPLDQPLPLPLIVAIVKCRVGQNSGKKPRGRKG